ncbi:zf-TFIIB domain-containing protein [uncultured Lentibacter sp.]|uniref:TFIIB-type zinc ribbon-containing protein n=1 Tax=uncultured Lentibacter sp. TaxID=1659309 RepID=UPI002618654A|nr:zf-TFIIB domain-containing protein [uncultured Lentibacter sp.]
MELDYCPRCRGVWLDRGELDKIIEVAARQVAVPAQMQAVPVQEERALRRGGKSRKKRGGFADILEDLFDFD